MIVSLIIVLIVAALLYWVISLIPLPQPLKNIVLAICALILVLYLVRNVLHVQIP